MNGKGPKIVKVSPRHMNVSVVLTYELTEIHDKTDEELAALADDVKRFAKFLGAQKDEED